MKKTTWLVALALIFFNFTSAAQELGGYPETTNLSSHKIANIGSPLITQKNHQDVIMMAFGLNASSKTLKVKRISFKFNQAKNVQENNFVNVRLIVDRNADAKIDSGDYAVGGQGLVEIQDEKGGITFLLHFLVESREQPTNYLLVSDLRDFGPDARLLLELKTEEISVETIDGQETTIQGFAIESSVFFGNDNAPVLSWPIMRTDYKEGVNAEVLNSGNYIQFLVGYLDADGHAPKRAEVWVDWKGNGEYEKIPLKRQGLSRFSLGNDFQSSPILALYQGSEIVRYRFYFTDGDKEATGEPTQVRQIKLYPFVKLNLTLNRAAIVSSEEVIISGYVDWLLGVKVDFTAMKINDWKPWRLINFSIGPEEISPLDYNRSQRFVSLSLVLPENSAFTNYKIPWPSLPFKAIVEREGKTEREIKDQILGPEFQVKKSPCVLNSDIPRKNVVFGDSFEVILRISCVSDIDFSVGQLERLNFHPFDLKARSVQSYNLPKRKEIIARYALLALMPAYPEGVKVKIPELTLFYFRNSKEKEALISPAQEVFVRPYLDDDALKIIHNLGHDPHADTEAIIGFSVKNFWLVWLFLGLGALAFAGAIIFLVTGLAMRKSKEGKEEEIVFLPPDKAAASKNLASVQALFRQERNPRTFKLLYYAFCGFTASLAGIAENEIKGIRFLELIADADFIKKSQVLKTLGLLDKMASAEILEEEDAKKLIDQIGLVLRPNG